MSNQFSMRLLMLVLITVISVPLAAKSDVLTPVASFAQELNFGLKTTHIPAGKSVWVPVYLVNNTATGIDSCAFSLGFDTSLFVFVSAEKDSGFIADWSNFAVNASKRNLIDFRLGKGAGGGFAVVGGWEIIRCQFTAKNTAQDGAESVLSFRDASVFSGKTALLSLGLTSARLIVGSALPIPGDIDGDGVCNEIDSRILLNFAVGKATTDCCPNFNYQVADISGNGYFTSFDAALIGRHAVGLMPDLPLPAGSTLGASGAIAPVQMKLIQKKLTTANTYDYVLRLINAKGLMSAEFVVAKDYQVQGWKITKAGISGSSVLESSLGSELRIALYDNAFGGDSVDILEFQVRYVDANHFAGCLFTRALLNEGRMPFGRITYPENRGFNYEYSYPGASPQGWLQHYPGSSTVAAERSTNKRLVENRISISGNSIRFPASVSQRKIRITSVSGRAVKGLTTELKAGKAFVDISGLSAGSYILTVIGDGAQQRIVFARP